MPVIENEKYILKIIGIIGWVIGLIVFLISFMYMTEAISSETIGALASTNFFGLLGVAFFTTGTIIYIKSLDYKQ
ncbi:MAG: hypothetical protein ACFFB2_08225 [Promethearchaeota archaeon]